MKFVDLSIPIMNAEDGVFDPPLTVPQIEVITFLPPLLNSCRSCEEHKGHISPSLKSQ